jgi:hypothetical protein
MVSGPKYPVLEPPLKNPPEIRTDCKFLTSTCLLPNPRLTLNLKPAGKVVEAVVDAPKTCPFGEITTGAVYVAQLNAGPEAPNTTPPPPLLTGPPPPPPYPITLATKPKLASRKIVPKVPNVFAFCDFIIFKIFILI